jgi:hypothetical protein
MTSIGEAAVAMWWDVDPEVRPDWEEWHTYEHMPERLSIPGFLRGTRWTAVDGAPFYFVLYEAWDLATITSGAYLERLNDPTPWSRSMMPHHRNMVRSVCVVQAAYGTGVGQAMATIRLPEGDPELPRRKGLTGAKLLRSVPLTGKPTAEQKLRGGDATSDRVLLIAGYDVDAVRAAAQPGPPGAIVGLYRLAYCLEARR